MRTGERRGRAGSSTRPPRDQSVSAFTSILAALLSRIPGARSAALVDFQGETVDYAGCLTPFDVRLAAAHWRLVLDDIQAEPSGRGLTWLAVRAARRSYLIHALPERYALVIVLVRAAGFGGWQRAVAACLSELAREASWKAKPERDASWYPVEVTHDSRHRPRLISLANRCEQLEILGMVVRQSGRALASTGGGRGARERAWRVRLASGAETTLVREPGGAWYADQLLDGTKHAQSLNRPPSHRPRKSR